MGGRPAVYIPAERLRTQKGGRGVRAWAVLIVLVLMFWQSETAKIATRIYTPRRLRTAVEAQDCRWLDCCLSSARA